MAILMRMLSLGSAFALMGCGTAPELPVSDQIRHSIGWIDRQFSTCVGANCPRPTQKSLAVIERSRSAVFVSSQPPIDPAPSSPPTSEQIDEHVIHFDFGKSQLTELGARKMNALLSDAKKSIRIEVVGRTDDLGTRAFNDRLARQRAATVRDWLVRQGILALIKVDAEGMCCYVNGSRTEAARRQNRRTEIRLVHLVAKRDVVSSSNSKGVQ
jgi:outer membrane protein OmpA-like peptidoglycan-associated protein